LHCAKQTKRKRPSVAHESANKDVNNSRENAHSRDLAILLPLSPTGARTEVRSSDESVRVERSTKPGPKPPNHIDYGARVAASFEIERSRHWPEVVKRHLARQPYCVCCKPNVRNLGLVQVHHVFPFHYCVAPGRPDLALDERNLIALRQVTRRDWR